MVDSSVWIEFFNGTPTSLARFLDIALGIQSISVGDIILTEILQGFRSDKDFPTATSILADFKQLELLGTNRSIKAADMFRSLRKLGITVHKTNDVKIASYCIDEKLPLLFSDRNFNPFIGKLNLIPAIS